LALAAGATLEEVQQLLGHKKIATTADIYVKAGQEAMRNVVEALRRATGE
jgi:site-specific recombinase XerD